MDVSAGDICGSDLAPPQSSRGVASPDVSMRVWWQEGSAAEPEFWHAINYHNDLGRVREPWWYAVRFDHTRTRVLERLLGIIGLEYRLFTYEHRRPRRAPVTRSWLPGYFFVEFDVLDAWRQLLRVPGVIEVLDARIEARLIEDLLERLPRKTTAANECESIAPGTVVRVTTGTFEGYVAPVVWSERKQVRVLKMMFNRPVEIPLRTKDVEIVR